MHLRTFLDQSGTSVARFAERIGVHPQAVHRYLNGERIPRLKVMIRIIHETKGEVSADDFLPRTSEKEAA